MTRSERKLKMAVSAREVKEFRDATGLPMMECKKALLEAGGDVEKAKRLLRERGVAVAAKKAARETREGVVGAYVHHNQKVGVLVEVNCESDFVARNEDFKAFVKDLCMHVAWARPACVRREDLDPALVQAGREEAEAAAKNSEESDREKAVETEMEKFYAKHALLEQPFCKDESRTVGQALKDLIAKIRENITVRRFVRYELGE